MQTLLELAVTAHGGHERWNKLRSIRLNASITGAIWHLKGRPDVLKNVEIESDLKQEELRTRFVESGKRTLFSPDRISIESLKGTGPLVFDHPKRSFAGHLRETPWEDVHVAYFSGEALWTYLTAPFLYTYPGFSVEELSPWEEDGETWRRLKVLFPESVSSHCREQISYFGPDGLLRRHDYTVDVLGGATGANYASDYQTVDGIVIPTTRRVFAYQDDHAVVREPLLVDIELSEISFN